jgi:hypothetical protein
MKRRMLFPLRACPGLVPIRELDHDVVLVAIEWTPTSRRTRPMGSVSVERQSTGTASSTTPPQ